jgi:hypothetical protein
MVEEIEAKVKILSKLSITDLKELVAISSDGTSVLFLHLKSFGKRKNFNRKRAPFKVG